jgi:cobalt-zinc-cadmium efflux system outer membrane protein
MKRPHCIISIMTILFVLNGCSSERMEVVWPEPRPLGRELAAYKAPPQPSTAPAVTLELTEPQGTLTLNQALALALMKNPNLASFGWEVRAKEAQTLQASLRPNPELSIEIEDILLKSKSSKNQSVTVAPDGAFEIEQDSESGPPSGLQGAEYTIALSQVIEMGGKRAKRTRVAAMEQTVAGWDYETARLDILTEVTKAYIDVIAAQERIKLAKELVTLAEQSLNMVSQRVKVGKVSPMEESKAKVALATSRLQLEQNQRQLIANQKRLTYAWGTLQPCFTQAAGNLFVATTPPTEEALLCLISENPDIARWADEMDQRLAAIELAKAKRIPDLTVSGGYRWIGAENDSALVVGISSPLPIYDRNQGGIQESKYRFSKALESQQAAKLRVQTSLAQAYQELSSAYIEIMILREQVLPEAQNAFRASTQGFENGKFSYLEVLDAQRTLFEVRGQYIEALSKYHQSVAEVERLIGTPIIDVTTVQTKVERNQK